MEILQLKGVISKRKKKNWPICCPFIYHNISAIPKEFHRRRVIAYLGFFQWVLFWIVLLLICVTAYVHLLLSRCYKDDESSIFGHLHNCCYSGASCPFLHNLLSNIQSYGNWLSSTIHLVLYLLWDCNFVWYVRIYGIWSQSGIITAIIINSYIWFQHLLVML